MEFTQDDCPECEALRKYGRADIKDPVHCIYCHLTWTGNEAQHCAVCHYTFSSITAADAHRVGDGWLVEHLDPSKTEGWRELRPNVWTNSKPMTEEQKARMNT